MAEDTEIMTGMNGTEPSAAQEPQTGGAGDDWDDIDLSGLTDDAEEPVPQGEAQEEEVREEPQKEEPEAEETFTLKHLDETREVNRDEVVILAQKGMDYDRIRGDRDAAKAEIKRLSVMEDFLKELAESGGLTIEDLMDQTRANILAERDGIDRTVALERVKLERDRKALEAQTGAVKSQQAEEQRRRDSIDRFVKDHPKLDAKEIPKDVWDAFMGGKDLSDAWAVHENKILKEKLAAMEQNQKNQKRSTGSQASAGEKKSSQDDWFDKMWYDGT